LYASQNVIRVIKSRRMTSLHAASMGEMRNLYNILIGKPERKGSLARPRCRWEDNIRMDVRETEWKGVDWMCLVQDRNQ